MKAVEFKSRLRDRTIQIPDRVSGKLSENKDVRVIILLEEDDNEEEDEFKYLAQEQFLAGYSNSDSIYDDE